MDIGFWPILWTVCGIVTIVAALLAGRSARWRHVGRAATGVLFLIGGALMHVITLATGGDYASFADPAHFQWVTDSWRAVVAPNQLFFIGLLIVFEATVGLLAISGGRRTQLGYLGIIAFYLLLWLFGPIETVFILVILVPMYLLLRAERRAEGQPSRLNSASAVSMPRWKVG
ncbi:MAG TPA: hypothetical protein VFY98_02445 [Intrasporangium sp.]|nr:hypothetical protein [Intrasporangium sp.]